MKTLLSQFSFSKFSRFNLTHFVGHTTVQFTDSNLLSTLDKVKSLLLAIFINTFSLHIGFYLLMVDLAVEAFSIIATVLLVDALCSLSSCGSTKGCGRDLVIP